MGGVKEVANILEKWLSIWLSTYLAQPMVRSTSILVAVGVDEDGFREILGICEGAK